VEFGGDPLPEERLCNNIKIDWPWDVKGMWAAYCFGHHASWNRTHEQNHTGCTAAVFQEIPSFHSEDVF
jgi:hypothetical protein